jgi:hypothetical protein
MTKHSLFNAGGRDKNEAHILELLNSRHVAYTQLRPGHGADLLVQIAPMELWEIKNPKQTWYLTEDEKIKQAYCKEVGIPYIVIQFVEQANDRLNLYFART